VLFELLSGAAAVTELAARLREEPEAVRAAAVALAAAGLVDLDGEAVRATPATLYLDVLWPIVV
jgi:hypothetical protein